MTEEELRREQILDATRQIDYHCLREEWQAAIYHLQTIQNLLLAAVLTEERKQMESERKNGEVNRLKLIN